MSECVSRKRRQIDLLYKLQYQVRNIRKNKITEKKRNQQQSKKNQQYKDEILEDEVKGKTTYIPFIVL